MVSSERKFQNLLGNWKQNKKSISIYGLADQIRRENTNLATLSDSEVSKLCNALMDISPDCLCLSSEEKERTARSIFCCLRCELEILEDVFRQESVSEIMVNGPSDIFIEEKGVIKKIDLSFENQNNLRRVLQRLAGRVGREINDLNPILDARLQDGSRISGINSNIAINGPILTIRKFAKARMQMEDLIARGDISQSAADFLKELVACGYNIFISGGTSSGKTTFLNILSGYIPRQERIVVIEDSSELQIQNHSNVVYMESKAANAQGKGAIELSDLIKASLRMRPDRIIVGEVRGKEIIDMLAAMSTGHDGSLSTGHANSPQGMLSRLETLYLANSSFPLDAVRGQISQALEIIVQLKRFPGGHRKVIGISEITGMDGSKIGLNPLYVYKNDEGLVPSGNKLLNTEKMQFKNGL